MTTIISNVVNQNAASATNKFSGKVDEKKAQIPAKSNQVSAEAIFLQQIYDYIGLKYFI